MTRYTSSSCNCVNMASCFERKEFATFTSKLFPCRAEFPFQKFDLSQSKQEVTKVVSLGNNGINFYHVYPVLFKLITKLHLSQLFLTFFINSRKEQTPYLQFTRRKSYLGRVKRNIKPLSTCPKFIDSDYPAHAQSIVRAFALHSYIL